MDSGKLLEVLGNAKTVNNDNSSRFSKYLNIFIDCQNQMIAGYEMKTYLLEKSLVVNDKTEDRKFHVFYAIQECMSADDKVKFGFKAEFSHYSYLAKSLTSTTSVDYKQAWADINSHFATFAFTQVEQDAIFTLMAIILLMGNLTFQPESEKGNISVIARCCC